MLAVSIIFSFRDAKGKESTTKIRVPSTFSFAQYREFAAAGSQVLANMSTAELYDVSIAVGLDLSGASLKTLATQFADVFQRALLVVRSTVAGLFSRINIPTFDDANTVDGSDVLDILDPDVQALITLLEDGLDDGGLLILPVDARGNDLDEVSLAVEKFRKS
jgi:hypothetical protein